VRLLCAAASVCFGGNPGVSVAVSIVTLLLIGWLVTAEFSWWWTTEVKESMVVHQKRNEELRISFDVTFPGLSCSMIGVDAQDVTGQRHEGILHNIFKRRLNSEGEIVSRADSQSLGSTVTTKDALMKEKVQAMKEGRETLTEESAKASGKSCGSCYGAGRPGQCCSTCDEVRDLYKVRGWSFDAGNVQQCQEEGLVSENDGSESTGCNLYGFVMVPAVAGQVHFAPSSALGALHDRIFDLAGWTHSKWNATHTINKLSFGPFYEGRISPLDGVARVARGDATLWQYFVKVVPTEYVALSGTAVDSYQYSVTDHSRSVASNGQGLPGVHISYDLSPIRVVIKEERHSFGHFLVGLSAIIGGVYTIAQLVDTALYSFQRRGQARGARGILA
jgi:endoplasmic reticulum-Golgi intermediate compartment protein 3